MHDALALEHEVGSFTLFPQLLKELRLAIWEYALPAPRLVNMGMACGQSRAPDAKTMIDLGERGFHYPAGLDQACHEALQVFYHAYTPLEIEGRYWPKNVTGERETLIRQRDAAFLYIKKLEGGGLAWKLKDSEQERFDKKFGASA